MPSFFRVLFFYFSFFSLSLVHANPSKEGEKILRQYACTGCHQLSDQKHIGPGLAQVWGKPRTILRQGKRLTVKGDRSYILRALRKPKDEIVEGYSNVMPAYKLTASEEDAILATLKKLAQDNTKNKKDNVSLWHLILASLLFVFGHLGLSSLRVRDILIKRLGSGAFQGFYSLVALGAMLWLSWAWSRAPYIELWVPPAWTRYLPLLGMPVVCLLFVFGLTTPSPTTAGQENQLTSENAVRGILKITRHPSLWSFALWGLLHIPPNGDLASVLLFSSIVVLALAGMAHIDARRRATQGAAWETFAQQTSALPFLALFQGRNRVQRDDLSLSRLLLTATVYLVLLYTHQAMIGVSPFPY